MLSTVVNRWDRICGLCVCVACSLHWPLLLSFCLRILWGRRCLSFYRFFHLRLVCRCRQLINKYVFRTRVIHKLKRIHRFSHRTHSLLSNYPLNRLFFILRTTVLQFPTVLFPLRRLATARRATTPGRSPPYSHIYRNKAPSRPPRYRSFLPVHRCTPPARCPGGSPSRRWCVSARCR